MNKYKKYFSRFKKIKNLNLFFSLKLSNKKQIIFFKKLSFLINSGSTIIESIHLIKKQIKNKNKIKIFDQMIFNIKNGKSFADSMEQFQKTFNNFTINIIKAGELSGNLANNLNYLADELHKKEILKNKIRSALFYPIIIILSTISITIFLLIYIFPKIIPIFKNLNIKLPLSTQIILAISEFIQYKGLYILIGLFIFIIILSFYYKKNYKIKLFIDNFLLRLPLIGKIIRNYNLSNISRNFGLLLKSGMSTDHSLFIVSETIENSVYKKAFKNISLGVTKGKNISDILTSYPYLFPDIFCHMIMIGEKSGNLSDILIYLSNFYEDEFDELTKNLSNQVEPSLMIIMGIIISFIAISFITPIYEITNNLKR